MLYQDLTPSLQRKADPLINKMRPYVSKIKYKGTSIEDEIDLYVHDSSLRRQMDAVIDHYLALSLACFGSMSSTYHFESDPKFDRSMSGHEHIIYQEVTKTHKVKCIRQLLIGDSHADMYLPAFHICIEPSSASYFSRSKRSRAEELADYKRKRINDLYSFRIEKFDSTRQDIRKLIDWLKLDRGVTDLEYANDNFFKLACHSLPYFISHGEFISLLNGKHLTLVQ